MLHNIRDVLREKMPRMSTWYMEPLWAGWASSLDGSNIYYLTEEEYTLLAKLTQRNINVVVVRIGNVNVCLLGELDQMQLAYLRRCRIIWNADYTEICKDRDLFTHRELDIIFWAKYIDAVMQTHPTEVKHVYEQAFRYYEKHRIISRTFGMEMDIDMTDHDVSKTRLVHFALGFMVHEPFSKNKAHYLVAYEYVTKFHLQVEDHHPEYGNDVDMNKLFVDRIATGVQKMYLDKLEAAYIAESDGDISKQQRELDFAAKYKSEMGERGVNFKEFFLPLRGKRPQSGSSSTEDEEQRWKMKRSAVKGYTNGEVLEAWDSFKWRHRKVAMFGTILDNFSSNPNQPLPYMDVPKVKVEVVYSF